VCQQVGLVFGEEAADSASESFIRMENVLVVLDVPEVFVATVTIS
jgi:hypothetical protein